MSDFKLDAFLPYQVAVLARRLSRGFAEIYQEKFGLSVADWRVLAHLHDAQSCSVRDIHLQADMEKSRVSRSVARLEGRGLVRRAANRDDKRLLQLTLTEAGTAMMEELLPLATAYQAEVLGQLRDPARFQSAMADILAAAKSD